MIIPLLSNLPRLLLVTGILLLVAPMGPALAAAQSTLTLQEGDTVRFRPRDGDRRIEGQVVETTHDALHIYVDGEVREVASFDMRELEVRSGTQRMTGKGALIGLAAGMTVGILVASSTENEWPVDARGIAFAVGVPLLAVTGTLVGALVGTLHRTDRWITVAPVMGTAAGGAVSGVAISLSF